MVKTKFNKTFFGTELPIIQALMAGVQGSTSLGASAVQIGTAYLLCTETKTSQI